MSSSSSSSRSPAAPPAKRAKTTDGQGAGSGAEQDGYPVNTGRYSLPVKASSAAAQRWFDRGVAWLAGFHREEAAHCFSRCALLNPSCAMAHWGIAFSHGPDYNFAEGSGFYAFAAQPAGDKNAWPSLQTANAAAQRALRLAQTEGWAGLPQHLCMIEALALRYEWPVTADTPKLQLPYRAAMRACHQRFPADAEVSAVYAEAVMNLSPWKLYDSPGPKGAPNALGSECAAALDKGLSAHPKHLWLCHLKVHFNEMGPAEAFDWPAAEALRTPASEAPAADGSGAAAAAETVPLPSVDPPHEIGHLLHMPTHLDIQAGEYEKAIAWNQAGYEADLKLQRLFPSRFTVYSGYMLHNMEFCCWAAMYGGVYKAAMQACYLIEQQVTETVLRAHPTSPFRLELYLATRLMALVRFGRWADIMAVPFKKDKKLFLAHTLFLHYARGIALGARGRLAEARQEEGAFLELQASLKATDRIKHNVNIVEMAGVAQAVLGAEIQYRAGNFKGPDGAFARARLAVERFTSLPYDEPHGWLISPRQTLGALLTEQREFDEASAVYADDLLQFPRNVWSLTGLRACHLGRGKHAEAAALEKNLKHAVAVADTVIGASCACATEDWQKHTQASKGEAAPSSACCKL